MNYGGKRLHNTLGRDGIGEPSLVRLSSSYLCRAYPLRSSNKEEGVTHYKKLTTHIIQSDTMRTWTELNYDNQIYTFFLLECQERCILGDTG